MEEQTSTPNGGSKNRNLANYKEAKTKKVSDVDMEKTLKELNFPGLDAVNCMSFNIDEVILKNLLNNQSSAGSSSNPISTSSADSFTIDLEEILKNGVSISRSHDITPENATKIKRRRDKAKKARQDELEEIALKEQQLQSKSDNTIIENDEIK